MRRTRRARKYFQRALRVVKHLVLGVYAAQSGAVRRVFADGVPLSCEYGQRATLSFFLTPDCRLVLELLPLEVDASGAVYGLLLLNSDA